MPLANREDMPTAGDHLDLSSTKPRTPKILGGGKRKREPAATFTPPEIMSEGVQTGTHTEQLQQLFKDTLELLKSHDVSPSILNYTIPIPTVETPAAKRPKLVANTDTRTIAQLIQSNAYTSIDDLSRDVEAVTESVLEEIKSRSSSGEEDDTTSIKKESHPEIVRAMAFKQEFNNIILRELLQRPYLFGQEGGKDRLPHTEDTSPTKPSSTPIVGNNQDNRLYGTILTLFGGSNQPKQLFSSLKGHDAQAAFRIDDTKSKVNDIGLPNGINFTKIVPVHSKGSREDKKGAPTFKKLFAPPPSIQSLDPPRQSQHTATKSSSVNWYNPSKTPTSSRPNRRDSYSHQPLTTGQWLSYNTAPSARDMASPDSKRKQRDRALSFGEPQNELSERTLALYRQAKEDALFRSVYSGFAPDRDNAGALIAEPNKNRIWWKRVGERRYHDSTLRSYQDNSYEDEDHLSDENDAVEDGIQEVSLAEAVETWTPAEAPADFTEDQQQSNDEDPAATDVDEMLGEISEMLETLNSYQDVRNLSIPTHARTSASRNPQLSAMTGTPTSPSSDELDMYNMLKSQLSLVVASLPPYALAKLDGQRLGALGINTKIQVETPNYKGSLEEDEISTKGRIPATNAMASYPPRSSNAAIGLTPRNNYLAATIEHRIQLNGQSLHQRQIDIHTRRHNNTASSQADNHMSTDGINTQVKTERHTGKDMAIHSKRQQTLEYRNPLTSSQSDLHNPMAMRRHRRLWPAQVQTVPTSARVRKPVPIRALRWSESSDGSAHEAASRGKLYCDARPTQQQKETRGGLGLPNETPLNAASCPPPTPIRYQLDPRPYTFIGEARHRHERFHQRAAIRKDGLQTAALAWMG
ncbi:MAG: hypothetical protein Q9170_005888 [Blastenia crenularia]